MNIQQEEKCIRDKEKGHLGRVGRAPLGTLTLCNLKTQNLLEICKPMCRCVMSLALLCTFACDCHHRC